MTRRNLILLAGLGSLVTLLGAFGFQYLGGLAPCAMCLWQRWPHAAAIALGAIGAAIPSVAIALLGAVAMAVNSGIALFHTGVERGWWEGPSTCAGGEDLGALSGNDLLSTEGTGPVSCGEVAWEMFGLSMASWNGIICLILLALWIMAARRAA